MKIWYIILISLICAISLHPCSDKETIYENSTVAQSDRESHQIKDFCSPLCTCACCGISVDVISTRLSTENSYSYFDNSFPIYQETLSTKGHFSIWQPPKV
ncbi:DUF6660 family protein [Xanthocytophaga flavus]|uniref:DUF6660 family protein n=1 Tax=Xanthocytophaga flava TaxID=3048013 RepID=UPI00391F234B